MLYHGRPELGMQMSVNETNLRVVGFQIVLHMGAQCLD